MKKLFVKYVSQNILGMVGMSLYILADTFFISKAVGSNGITALNLVLPVYNLIFAIGAMIGVGSAIRYVVEKNKGDTSSESYFFHALLWCIIISVIFILIGIFIPDKLVGLLGGDSTLFWIGAHSAGGCGYRSGGTWCADTRGRDRAGSADDHLSLVGSL